MKDILFLEPLVPFVWVSTLAFGPDNVSLVEFADGPLQNFTTTPSMIAITVVATTSSSK